VARKRRGEVPRAGERGAEEGRGRVLLERNYLLPSATPRHTKVVVPHMPVLFVVKLTECSL
jgi:hypothetical protein